MNVKKKFCVKFNFSFLLKINSIKKFLNNFKFSFKKIIKIGKLNSFFFCFIFYVLQYSSPSCSSKAWRTYRMISVNTPCLIQMRANITTTHTDIHIHTYLHSYTRALVSRVSCEANRMMWKPNHQWNTLCCQRILSSSSSFFFFSRLVCLQLKEIFGLIFFCFWYIHVKIVGTYL